MYRDSFQAHLDQCVILRDIYFYSLDATRLGLVLTPACDIAQSKAVYVQVCALFPAWEFISSLLRNDWSNIGALDGKGNLRPLAELSNSKKSDLLGKIKQLVGQRFPRYHWFAPFPGDSEPLVGDFQNVTSLPVAEVAKLEVVAELLSPYREQVPARYAAYMGRVGTPDFEDTSIQQWIQSGMKQIFPVS